MAAFDFFYDQHNFFAIHSGGSIESKQKHSTLCDLCSVDNAMSANAIDRTRSSDMQ